MYRQKPQSASGRLAQRTRAHNTQTQARAHTHTHRQALAHRHGHTRANTQTHALKHAALARVPLRERCSNLRGSTNKTAPPKSSLRDGGQLAGNRGRVSKIPGERHSQILGAPQNLGGDGRFSKEGEARRHGLVQRSEADPLWRGRAGATQTLRRWNNEEGGTQRQGSGASGGSGTLLELTRQLGVGVAENRAAAGVEGLSLPFQWKGRDRRRCRWQVFWGWKPSIPQLQGSLVSYCQPCHVPCQHYNRVPPNGSSF